MQRLASTAVATLDVVKRAELPLRRWVLPDRFNRVEVETSSRCNRTCYYCPVSQVQRPDHLMDEALFHRILDQLAAMKFRGRFSPHFYGEPLLDARLPRLIREVKQRLPKVMVLIYTNGDPLTPKKATELLQAGVDLFLVTFEAGESKAFIATRAALPAWTMRRRFLVRHFKDDVKAPFNRGGSVLFPGYEHYQESCLMPASSLVIDAWGKVKLCANDYFGTEDWGDLNHEALADVWARPAFVALRRDLLNGVVEKQICKVCTGRAPAPNPLVVNAPGP